MGLGGKREAVPAREVVAEATGEISSVVGQAKDQMQTLMTDARTEIQQQADTRAAQAADGLRRLSWQFGAVAEGRPTDAPQLVEYMTTAQHRLSNAAERLEPGTNRIDADAPPRKLRARRELEAIEHVTARRLIAVAGA